MSETTTQTTDASEAQGAGDGAAGGTQTTEGLVSREELDRVETQRREFQARADRLQRELDEAKASGSTSQQDGGNDGGFDPAAFRRELMRDVMQASALQQAALTLKGEFPHADPSIFSEKLADFRSADALRMAAEASHRRVADALSAARTEIEEKVKKEFEERYGSGSGSPQGGGQSVPGDPTPEQLAAMSPDEWDALEQKSPGVIDRVLRSHE